MLRSLGSFLKELSNVFYYNSFLKIFIQSCLIKNYENLRIIDAEGLTRKVLDYFVKILN